MRRWGKRKTPTPEPKISEKTFTDAAVPNVISDGAHSIRSRTERIITLGSTTPHITVHGYYCTCGAEFRTVEEASAHMNYYVTPVPAEVILEVVRSLRQMTESLEDG